MLWHGRANTDALPEGYKIDDFKLKTIDGQEFSTEQINLPIVLIFFNTKTFFTSNLYPKLILKTMPELKKIEQAGYCKIIVLADVEQTENDIRKMLERKEYKVLENSVYLGNTELLANYFGVRSWPHFFLINTDNVILYQDKIPSSDKLIRILKGA
jgi:TusA-related sulfurtransferase